MHKLRPHQEVFVNSILQKLETHNKILGQAACGFGKTLCMTGFVKKNTLILVNSIDLLNQTVETFERQKIDLGTFTSNDKKFPLNSNVVAMTETVKKRIIKNPKLIEHFDLIIIDECHVIIYEMLFNYFDNKKVIGLTGTPVRLKRYKIDEFQSAVETMSDYFEDIIVSESVQWLIDNGYLCQEISEYIDFNYSGLKTDSTGEFTASSLKEVFESEDYIKAMLNTFRKKCLGKKTVLYTSATSTNELYRQRLTEIGFNCKTYDSVNNVTNERKEVVDWFENAGENSVLINTGCFTTGFSHDNIEVIFVARATMSLALWIQMIGRGARNSSEIEKPHFLLIDGGNNIENHGAFSLDRDWQKIFSDRKIKNIVEDIQECDECGFTSLAKEKICPNCGYEKPLGEEQEKELQIFEIKGRKIKPEIPTIDLNFFINKGKTKFETLKVLKEKWLRFLLAHDFTIEQFNFHIQNKFNKYLRPVYFKILGSILQDSKRVKYMTFCEQIISKYKKIFTFTVQ